MYGHCVMGKAGKKNQHQSKQQQQKACLEDFQAIARQHLLNMIDNGQELNGTLEENEEKIKNVTVKNLREAFTQVVNLYNNSSTSQDNESARAERLLKQLTIKQARLSDLKEEDRRTTTSYYQAATEYLGIGKTKEEAIEAITKIRNSRDTMVQHVIQEAETQKGATEYITPEEEEAIDSNAARRLLEMQQSYRDMNSGDRQQFMSSLVSNLEETNHQDALRMSRERSASNRGLGQ